MDLFYRLVGILLILTGIPLFWTPVPVGAVLILMGAALLVAHSAFAQKWVSERRNRHTSLDKWITKSEKYLPAGLARTLRKTHPRP